MKKCFSSVQVSFLLLVILIGSADEARGQADVQGVWSGTVKMRQEYTGELGHSVLEITTTFSANIGTGSMTYEAEWKGPTGTSKVSCSGLGQAELHQLAISEEDNTFYSYYIHVIGPDYTCSPPDNESGQNKRDITISEKVLISKINNLSGTQTETGDTGAGTVTTTIIWSLARSTVVDVELIVTPEGYDKNGFRKSYDDWLPQPGLTELILGSFLNISLKLQAIGGGPPKKKAKGFELKLINTSKEPGVTINFPVTPLTDPLPDLRFEVQSNASVKDTFQTLNINCSGCQTASAKIGSYDGGGWTILTAEAILQDETRVRGTLLVSGGEEDIPVPRRAPNTKIGEAWLKNNNNPREMDDKESSNGNKNKGDGLTAYEEYRGVISEGKFKRLDPSKKEVGVWATQTDFTLFSEGIRWFESASDLKVVRFDFDRDEIAGGQLNVNNKSAHDYDQYALYLLNGGLGGSVGKVYARTKPIIPAEVIGVIADWNRIQSAYQDMADAARPDILKFALTDYLAQTVAHELGHAVNIRHHGNDETSDVYVSNTSDDYRIFNRNNQLITTRPYLLSSVGMETGTVESGDILCMLNYYPYYNWGHTIGADGAHIYNQEPLLPIGKIFCTDKKGTGINATKLFFGDADNSRGDCLGQIKLRN